jgi:hypothetical protein
VKSPSPETPIRKGLTALGIAALLFSAKLLGQGQLDPKTTSLAQITSKNSNQIKTISQRNFSDKLIHQVNFGGNLQHIMQMNNGSVRPLYVYNNQAYAKYNNGLYPVQTTSNIIGNLRLQRVPNSKPLVFPSPLKISNINSVRFTNIIKRDPRWFGLLGTKTINTSSREASLLRALSNNIKDVVTPSQANFVVKSMPQSIQNGIKFLLQKSNQPPVINVSGDETGMSQKDKETLKRQVGDKVYNFIIENWKKLPSSSKNIFKAVGSSAATGFGFYAAEILLNIGWVATTGTPPPPAIGMVLRSGKIIASGGL